MCCDKSKKPLGLVLIVIYTTMLGLLLIPGGLLLLIEGQTKETAGVLLTPLGFSYFMLGVFLFAAIYGLWTFQKWGRKTMIFNYLAYSILCFISLFPILPSEAFNSGNHFMQIVGIVTSVVVIYYLTRNPVKLLFSEKVN